MRSTSLTFFCALAVLSVCSRAAPVAWDKPAASASTGNGGNAPGGSVYGSPPGEVYAHSAGSSLISAFSGNAGNGGDASSSGDALATDSSRTNSPGNVLEGTPFGGGSLVILSRVCSFAPLIILPPHCWQVSATSSVLVPTATSY
ncbi:hypothetical protein DFH09DRAFT_1122663, partial [Mycena vulgaris]